MREIFIAGDPVTVECVKCMKINNLVERMVYRVYNHGVSIKII